MSFKRRDNARQIVLIEIGVVVCIMFLLGGMSLLGIHGHKISNQATAAETKANYIIEHVVPDQIIMVEIKFLNSFTGAKLPSILAEGVQAVSKDYDIKQITPINKFGMVYSTSYKGTVTAALMLMVEPKDGSS